VVGPAPRADLRRPPQGAPRELGSEQVRSNTKFGGAEAGDACRPPLGWQQRTTQKSRGPDGAKSLSMNNCARAVTRGGWSVTSTPPSPGPSPAKGSWPAVPHRPNLNRRRREQPVCPAANGESRSWSLVDHAPGGCRSQHQYLASGHLVRPQCRTSVRPHPSPNIEVLSCVRASLVGVLPVTSIPR